MKINWGVRLCGLMALAGATMAAGPNDATPAPVPAASAAAPAPVGSNIVAQYGALSLTQNDVQTLISTLDPATRDRVLHNSAAMIALVRNQMLQLSLLAEAKSKQWDQRPDVAFRANQAHDSVIVDSYIASLSVPDSSYPTEADIQAAYDSNKARFAIPRMYHLAQIFLQVPTDAPAPTSDAAQKKLARLRLDAFKPGADFTAMARTQSQDTASAPKGGEIGWVREDQLAPEIKAAIANLRDNGLSEPVRMADGWHLVKLLGSRPATIAALADVHDQLSNALRQQRAQQNARAILADRQQKQPIQLDEIQLSHMLAPATP